MTLIQGAGVDWPGPASRGDGLRRRSECRRRVDGVSGETLEQAGFTAIDAEMMQLHLRLGPGQGGRALEGAGVMVFVHETQDILARGGDHGPEVDPRSRPRRDPYPAAQGEDRIEHGAHRAAQGPPVEGRGRDVDITAAADKTGPIGFELALADILPIDDRQVGGPDFRVAGRAPTPSRQDRAETRQVLGFDKQLGERGVGDVGGGGRQHEFRVGCHLDLSCLVSEIGERDPAHLGVIFGGDEHLQGGRQCSVAPRELGPILVEGDLVDLGLGAQGLIGGRPSLAARHIAKQNVRAPVVAGGVFAPAGDGEVPPMAVT